MQIKRFEAKDMTEALKMVKNEFGSQAVILSAKTIKKSSGLFGAVRKAGVEITAASDRYRSIDYTSNSAGEQKDIFKSEFYDFPDVNEKVTVFKSPSKIENVKDFLSPGPNEEVKQEKNLIRRLNLNLTEQGVSELVIRKIVDELSILRRQNYRISLNELRKELIKAVSKMITVSDSFELKHGKPSVIVFIGPTGVGKTTTIAKLSAINALVKGRSIALLSIDDQRVGATVTLEKYSKIIGLPYRTVVSSEDLKETISIFQDKNFILVDTPGLAAGDQKKIEQMAGRLKQIMPDEIHLLLSATTKDQDMIRLYDAYIPLQANRLIFTKIDETTCFGNLLNLIYKKRTPLSYVTNGQQVPEDIINAQSDTIAELIFNDAYPKSNPAMQVIESIPIVRSYKPKFPKSGNYFVANKNSDIFHHKDCKAVERINTNNVIIFHKIFDALEQKFKPCRMCCHEKIENNRLIQRIKQKVAVSH